MMLWPPISADVRLGWKGQTVASGESAGPRGTSGSPAIEALAPAGAITRRIIFLNRYFYPDHSATSQILTDLAFHLAGCGIGLRVITSRQRYDDPQAHLPEAESIGGVM